MHRHKNITAVERIGYPMAAAALAGMVLAPGVAAAADDHADEASGEAGAPVVSQQTTNAAVPAEKKETVRLFANASGDVRETRVETTLTNPTGADDLADSSELENLENAESDNGYSGTGANIVWDAAGSDVVYKGTTDKEAPISLRVTYFLDGEETAPEDLLGAAGHVSIRYEFQNSSYTVNSAGKRIYTPFACITGVLLDGENFHGVVVANGRVVEDGDRLIAVGYAMPGMQESTGVSAYDLDIPSYFEISADVDSFEIGSSLTMVTAGLLDDVDTDDLADAGLGGSGAALQDAMSQVLDGSSALTDGLRELATGTAQAADGASALASGAGELSSGAGELSAGAQEFFEGVEPLPAAVEQLDAGAAQVAAGAAAASEGVAALDAGLSQLAPGVAAAADGSGALQEGAAALASGTTELAGAVAQLQAGAAALAAGLDPEQLAGLQQLLSASAQEIGGYNESIASLQSSADRVAAGATQVQEGAAALAAAATGIDTSGIEDDAVRAELAAQIATLQDNANALASSAGTVATGATALAQAPSSFSNTYTGMAASTLQGVDMSAAATGAGDLADGLAAVQGALGTAEDAGSIVGGATALAAGAGDLQEGLDAASTGLLQVQAGAAQLASDAGLPALASGAGQVAQGVEQLNAHVPELAQGAASLADGADGVAEGADQVAQNLTALAGALAALGEGAASAADGSSQLTEGLSQFSSQGITQVVDMFNQMGSLTDNLRSIADAGRAYTNFGGITEGTQGSVKFVIETDPIEAD